METYFASPERLSGNELIDEIEYVGNNAIVNGLLNSVSGLLAILNEHRQILTLNQSLLKALGLSQAAKVLGFRLGEAVKCIHSHDMPGGCGTSEYCSTCGAVISIVTSLASNEPVEKECAITVENMDKKHDLYFRIRCVPVTFNMKKLLLVFLQDITYQQRLAALERLFFHDINGIIAGMVMASSLISLKAENSQTKELAQKLMTLSNRLASEVSVQQCLVKSGATSYQPVFTAVTTTEILNELKELFSTNPVSSGKKFTISYPLKEFVIKTEFSLLIRVLSNMITNAFEETSYGDVVKLWVDFPEEKIVFSIWNKKSIPDDIKIRIFSRNFSTKAEMGRGLGTYSMKLFGEEVLGGEVTFTSSSETGTVFSIALPLKI